MLASFSLGTNILALAPSKTTASSPATIHNATFMRFVLVITGSRDLLPREDTDLAADVLGVIRASHGVLVPLTRESARQAAAPEPPIASDLRSPCLKSHVLRVLSPKDRIMCGRSARVTIVI